MGVIEEENEESNIKPNRNKLEEEEEDEEGVEK